MKKRKFCLKLIILTVFFVFIGTSNTLANETSTEDILESQKDSLNISGFLEEADKYTSDLYGDMDVGEIFNKDIKGERDNESIIKRFLSIIGKEIIDCIGVLGTVIVIIVIHSILKSISDGLENKTVSQIVYYVQYILIVTLIMVNFSDVISMVRNSIDSLVGFMNSLIPILITLMLTTGSFTSAGLLEPILLFLITFIGNFINMIIIPFVLISTALAIVSKVSERIQLDKLSKFFNSAVIWVLGIVLTIFVGLASVEGSLSSTVDGVTAKTTKAAVSNFIPVVGKILGDAVETVIGCGAILKNAVGIIGVIVVISICMAPIIKLAILMGLYYLCAAVCQPIADGKIIKLLDQMGDTFKILFAILCSISIMLIIGVTLVIKISNSGLMYR